MKYIIYMFFGFSSLVVVTSCSPSLSPFTDDVYAEFDHSDREMRKIQFYLSSDIVLYRDFGNSNSKVENGTIKFVDGRKIEEVVFKKGTPGVFLFSPKRESIAVSFEAGDDNYLMFGSNEKAGGRFVLLAKEWNRRTGKVSYAGKTWNTNVDNAYANLLVDLDRARKVQIEKKTVSGRRVNE